MTELEAENQALRDQLAKALDTLEAIRSGGVDARVATGPQGDQVFTLQGAETPYRVLIESMNEGAATIERDGTILYCNSRFGELAGAAAESIVGRCLCEWVVPAQRAAVREFVAGASSAGAKAEFRFKGPGGRELPVLVSLRPIAAEGGSLAVVATDLSEPKSHAEQLQQFNRELEERVQRRTAELHQSEQRYRLLFDRNPDGVFAVDATGRFVLANPACAAISGYSQAELQQKTFQELCAPDQLATTVERFERTFREAAPCELETAVLRQDGRRVELWITGELLLIDEQTVIHCTAKDITARRQSEQALCQAQEDMRRERDLLQAVMNGATQSHLVYLDRDFNFVRVNETYARGCGYRPEEMVGKNHFALYPHPESQAIFARVRDTGQPIALHDRPFQFPDQPGRGTTYWDWTLTPVKTAEGAVEGLVLALHETTARKQIEEQLRKSERDLFEANQRLQALMQALPVGVSFSDDPSCQRITGNPAVLAQFEVRPEDNLSASAPNESAPGRRVRFFREGQPITDADLPLQRAVAENREIPPLELEVLLPSGRRWVAQASGAPIRNREGSVVAGVAVTMDITARKQAEAAVRASRQMLESVINHLPAAITLIRGNDLRLLLFNPAYQAIAPGKLMEGKTLDELWPETGQDFSVLCRRVLETGQPHEVSDERNMIRRRPDGPLEQAYFSWALHRVPLPGMEGWAILNAAWETTQRVEVEQEVRRQAQELLAQNKELTRFNEAMVGRELRMIELKEEINALCHALGRPRRYSVPAAEPAPSGQPNAPVERAASNPTNDP